MILKGKVKSGKLAGTDFYVRQQYGKSILVRRLRKSTPSAIYSGNMKKAHEIASAGLVDNDGTTYHERLCTALRLLARPAASERSEQRAQRAARREAVARCASAPNDKERSDADGWGAQRAAPNDEQAQPSSASSAEKKMISHGGFTKPP